MLLIHDTRYMLLKMDKHKVVLQDQDGVKLLILLTTKCLFYLSCQTVSGADLS